MDRPALDDAEQERRRAWFKHRWQHDIAYHRLVGVETRRWDPEAVVLFQPYRDEISAHEGILHGGIVAALIDGAGTGAILAGHDFAKGSRISTVSLAVQYLSAARGSVEATAHATRRGSTTHFAEVHVSDQRGRLVASGQVTAIIAGERPGLLDGAPS